jgi:MFS family permease
LAVEGWRRNGNEGRFPANRQPSTANHLLAAAIFAILAIANTWPLAPNLDRAVSDPGDPLINTWILDWGAWATLHQPFSLFHANAFHPAQYSLAYSENLYGVALLLLPLRIAGVGPVAAYNLAMLAGIALCGLGAYLLGSRLTGSFVAGLAAGIFYAFVPFRFVHLSHVQHAWGGWLPLLLWALLRYGERPTWKRGAVFAALFLMNGLTNIHYLLFGALASAITAGLLIPRRHWRELAIPTAAALVVLVPFLYPYLAVAKLYDMQRTWEEVWTFSAVARDWLPGTAEPERRLYPGALAFVGAALALFTRDRVKLALGLVWIALGFLGSLGLNFVFHEFLFGAVPGFRAIRVPARWAVIAYVGLAVLIALVTAAVARRNRWAAWIVPAAFAVTLWGAPVRWYLLDPVTPPVYRWLATQNVSAIAELPMDEMSGEYEYMLHATAHHRRMVNGVSGFAPPLRKELSRLSNETPIPDAFLDALRRADVELVIVHPDRYGARAPAVREWVARELARGRLHYVRHFDARLTPDFVFSLRGGAGGRPRDLDVYLAGGAVCTSSVTGMLEFPLGAHEFRGAAQFRGWAASPHGIAAVDLWFNNRRVRHRVPLRPISFERCPGAPPVAFEARFAARPAAIREFTDVQVEITDRRGRTIVLDDRWMRWQ